LKISDGITYAAAGTALFLIFAKDKDGNSYLASIGKAIGSSMRDGVAGVVQGVLTGNQPANAPAASQTSGVANAGFSSIETQAAPPFLTTNPLLVGMGPVGWYLGSWLNVK